MEGRFEIVPITVVQKNRLNFIYIITYVTSYQWNYNEKRVLDIDMLSKKYSISSKVGMKTLSLTAYLKKNCNYDLSLAPREYYAFHTIDDAKKAIEYLNDCMVAKKLVKG